MKQFYDAVRTPLFDGSISTDQVAGMDAILEAADGLPIEHVAYIFATAYHETGAAMFPNRENMNYTKANWIVKVFGKSRLRGRKPESLTRNPKRLANTVYGGSWGKKNLGNTIEGHGYFYRGGGMDHTTGLANYEKASVETGLDLIENPDLILDPKVAAQVIVTGMVSGRYRGRKLADFDNFVDMRDIINADKRRNGALIAGHADKFLAALHVAKWGEKPQKNATDKGFWANIMELFR